MAGYKKDQIVPIWGLKLDKIIYFVGSFLAKKLTMAKAKI